MDADGAQIIGLRALAWLASEDEILPIFLSAAGTDLDGLRQSAMESGTLLAVLDFVAQSDQHVLACAEHLGIAPESIVSAQALLAGRAGTHWT